LRTSSDRSLAGAAVPVIAALAVLLFACGSSSVHVLLDIGHSGRWVVLVLLLAASAWWAAERGPALSVDPAVAAAAIFLVLVAAASSTWSVAPRLTFERAATLAVLVLIALLIAHATAGGPADSRRVLAGLVAGSVLVALAGVLVYVVAHHDAVEIASPEIPPRFKGMGQNPNTSSLLFAVAAPNAAWMSASAYTVRQRLLWASALTLLAASIVASGSHGALVAAGAGCAAVGFLAPRRGAVRATAIAAVAVTVVAGFWIETLPQPSRVQPPSVAAPSPPPSAKRGYTDAEINTPLNGELGIPLPGQKNPRTLVSSSGRTEAWRGAIRQAEQRPIAGYGFGTESRVFIDRWWTFTGGVPENSYIGIALQLGVAGLLAFGALLAALSRCAFRAFVRRHRRVVAAGLGVLVAALVAAVGQSYIYSVGDVATITVWISVFLLASIRRADV
jgi:O-Antigen ligase